jgi:hypothetical protein
MCNFFSALVLRNGDVLSHPSLDSHSDLVTYFQLPDVDAKIPHFAKVELTPGDNWLTPETWAFRVDEDVEPIWWKDIAEQAEAKVRSLAAKMVLTSGRVPLLCDGSWILGGDVRVDRVVAGARILRVQDKASISVVMGGTFSAVWGGTFSAVRGGTFSDVRGGTFSDVCGGTFSDVCGGTFSAVWGGTFSDVCGGTFSAVWGGTFSDVCGGTFSAVRGGTFSAVRGGTFSAVWGGTKILLHESYGHLAKLDDSAKAHLVQSISQAVKYPFRKR